MTSKEGKNQVRDHVKQARLFLLFFLFSFLLFERQQGFDSLLGAALGVLNLFRVSRSGDGNGGGRVGQCPAGIDPNRRTFNFKDNEISENKGDTKGFINFGNRVNSGRYSGNSENSKMKDNEGKIEGFQDVGNDYSGNSEFDFENNKIKGNEGETEGFQDFGNDN